MAPPASATYVAEFVGTFLLVLTIGCNVLSNTGVWTGVSIASSLMVAIYSLGGISGANFNPAVSFSLGLVQWMGKDVQMPWKKVGLYALFQVIGGIVAGLCYAGLFWDTFNLQAGKGFSLWQACLCELLYTFMLCHVVLNVAASKGQTGNQFYGLAIGFVIVAGAYGAGVVSGGCFNPAVAIGIDTASAGLGFGVCLLYTVVELLGAALAALTFKALRPGDFAAPVLPTPEGESEKAKEGAETEPEKPQDEAKLLSEVLGTYMLVLTVGLNVLGKSPAGAYSIAAALMCMIYATGDISGAHFNPAVSLAIFLTKKDENFGIMTMGKYMMAQFMGGILAAFTYAIIYRGTTFGLPPKNMYSWAEVAIAEIVFTFVLCYVVLCVAVDDKTKSKDMYGLAIGACVTVGGFAIGKVSGGSLNPAVSVGIETAHLLDGGLFYKTLGYCVLECIGAGLAAGVMKVTHAEEVEEDGSKTKEP